MHGFLFPNPDDRRLRGYEVLQLQRKAIGLSVKEVAEMAHITIKQYERYENGTREVGHLSLRTGLNICRALQLDPYYFCDYPEDSPKFQFIECPYLLLNDFSQEKRLPLGCEGHCIYSQDAGFTCRDELKPETEIMSVDVDT